MLARGEPDAYNVDWAMSLGNLADVLLLQVDFDEGEVYKLAKKAADIFSDLSKTSPNANKKWRAFVMRSLAEAYLARGNLPEALECSRAAVQAWSDVHRVSPGSEIKNTINSTYTLMRCEIANGLSDQAEAAFERWILENARFVQNEGAPGKKALRKMAAFVLTDLGQSSFDKFPENVQIFGDLDTISA